MQRFFGRSSAAFLDDNGDVVMGECGRGSEIGFVVLNKNFLGDFVVSVQDRIGEVFRVDKTAAIPNLNNENEEEEEGIDLSKEIDKEEESDEPESPGPDLGDDDDIKKPLVPPAGQRGLSKEEIADIIECRYILRLSPFIFFSLFLFNAKISLWDYSVSCSTKKNGEKRSSPN